MAKFLTRGMLKALFVILILTFINVYIPPLSIFTVFLWPLPVITVTVRNGMDRALKLVLVAALVNGLVFQNALVALYTIIGFGLIGFAIGGALAEGFTPFKTLIISIMAVLFSILTNYYALHFLIGFDFNTLLQEMAANFTQIGGMLGYGLDVEEWVAFVRSVIPSALVIGSIIFGSIVYYLSVNFLNIRRDEDNRFEVYKPFRYWRFPAWLITSGLVISLFFLDSVFFLNLQIVFLFLSFIQGLSLAIYYLVESGNKAFLWALILFFGFLIHIMVLPVAILGLVDMWFNLRRFKK
ncbi:YybS family protein [Halothermothrix orenii]|uniref:Predicted membrane protein n=1 Tax=Halothermothrix orenii (strain H 168 / OCM 544 / DSM 9562) TaxID=373903 RepID=B8D1C6_HALOH|nr:YybS family protein [Halothermothrix orenii]ACL71078.1 predicted membrane protein [Halothermothrix orenii H 168]